MVFFVRKAALSLCFCLALDFFLPFSSLAAELTLDAEVGFHGLFHLGDPFPLTVDIANQGRPVEGTLEVQLWKGGAAKGIDAYPFYYRREVVLSAQSRKSVQFTIDPDSLSRPLVVSFSSQTIKVSKEIDLRRHFSPSPLILLLTESSAPPSIPSLSGSSGPVISLSIRQLPSEARAYQGVWSLVLYEQSLRDLTKFQTAALDQWLSSGGRLVILGSIHHALYQESLMSRFLPVRVVGIKRLAAVPALEALYQKPATLSNLLAQDSRPVAGKVLIEEKGLPILVAAERGKGKIVYLSLDVGRPPLARWEGLPLLFRDLLGAPVERRAPPQTRWDESVFSQLLSQSLFTSAYVPVRSFLVWVLFYLTALGLLAALWLRQRFSRRTLLLVFFFLVVFASLGGGFHFRQGGNVPDGMLLSSTLLESLPDGYAEVEASAALFSTQSRHYRLQINSGWSEFQPIPRLGRAQEAAMTLRGEGDSTRFEFPLREWDYRLFKIRAASYFPVRAEIKNQESRLSLILTNLTANDLTGCWLVASGQKFFLGDVPRGSSQSREFSLAPESSSRPGEFKNRNSGALRDIVFNDKTQEILFRSSFFPQDAAGPMWAGSAAILFGWVNNGPRQFWLEDATILSHSYALFRLVVPLNDEDDL